MIADWGYAAAAVWADLGVPSGRVDALRLARDLGVDVVGGGPPTTRLVGTRVVQVSDDLHPAVLQGEVAVQLARVVLRAHDLPEAYAADCAAALMLPDALLTDAQLRDPGKMRSAHLAPWGLVVRRIGHLVTTPPVLTLWQGGEAIYRVSRAHTGGRTPVDLECRAMRWAIMAGAPQVIGPHSVRAWSVRDEPGIDAVTSCPADVVRQQRQQDVRRERAQAVGA